ncbi:MAG TPA: hypothetical protein VNF47_23455 [Streptosporangiaceae bacterium]|nr:hypothetical protein [Streptosporangiaceae bacterium]
MPEATVIPLRPRRQPAYTDTAALNDIHALLTTTSTEPAQALTDVGLILVRSGRPMTRARHIEVPVTETTTGWPTARVDAEDTTVTVAQDPAANGLAIDITTTSPAERDSLTITLDGRRLNHPHPPGDTA